MKYTLKQITERDYIIGINFKGIEAKKDKTFKFTHSANNISAVHQDYTERYDSDGRRVELITGDFKRTYQYITNDVLYKVISFTHRFYDNKNTERVKTYDVNKSELTTSTVNFGKISRRTQIFNKFGNTDIRINNRGDNTIITNNIQTIYDDKNRICTILCNNAYTNIYYNDDTDIPCLLIHNGQIIDNINKKTIRNTIRELMVNSSSFLYKKLNTKFYEIVDENGTIIDYLSVPDTYGNIFINGHVVQVDLYEDYMLPSLNLVIEDGLIKEYERKFYNNTTEIRKVIIE